MGCNLTFLTITVIEILIHVFVELFEPGFLLNFPALFDAVSIMPNGEKLRFELVVIQ